MTKQEEQTSLEDELRTAEKEAKADADNIITDTYQIQAAKKIEDYLFLKNYHESQE